jgi:hypothetical protein
VRNFLFNEWAVRVLRPMFDSKVQPLRAKMEVLAMGKVPMTQALYSGQLHWTFSRRTARRGRVGSLMARRRTARRSSRSLPLWARTGAPSSPVGEGVAPP